jgi:hypothetical protein
MDSDRRSFQKFTPHHNFAQRFSAACHAAQSSSAASSGDLGGLQDLPGKLRGLSEL